MKMPSFNLSDESVSTLCKILEKEKNNQDFPSTLEDVLNYVVAEYFNSLKSDGEIMSYAIDKVNSMEAGCTFTLRDIIEKEIWEQIEKPKVFGKIFMKKICYFADVLGKNASNKTLYRRNQCPIPGWLLNE